MVKEHYISDMIYFKFLVEDHFIILLLYVNDILIVNNSKLEVEKVKAELDGEFDMKDLKLLKRF